MFLKKIEYLTDVAFHESTNRISWFYLFLKLELLRLAQSLHKTTNFYKERVTII